MRPAEIITIIIRTYKCVLFFLYNEWMEQSCVQRKKKNQESICGSQSTSRFCDTVPHVGLCTVGNTGRTLIKFGAMTICLERLISRSKPITNYHHFNVVYENIQYNHNIYFGFEVLIVQKQQKLWQQLYICLIAIFSRATHTRAKPPTGTPAIWLLAFRWTCLEPRIEKTQCEFVK